MKKLLALVAIGGMLFSMATARAESSASSSSSTDMEAILQQYTVMKGQGSAESSSASSSTATAEGGEAGALSVSGSSITTISKVPDPLAPAVGVVPPYPPFFLPNGGVSIAAPVGNDGSIYQRTYNAEDVAKLKEFFRNRRSNPYKGILEEFFTDGWPVSLQTFFERKGWTIINTITDRTPRLEYSPQMEQARRRTDPNWPGPNLCVIEDVPNNNDGINRKGLLRQMLLKEGYIPIGGLKIEGDEQRGFLHGLTGHSFTHDFDLAAAVAVCLAWEYDVSLLVFDGGIQPFGKGQTSYPGGSIVSASHHISVAAVGAGLSTKSETRAKPVFRCTAYKYDPIRARKVAVSDKILSIRNAVVKLRLPKKPSQVEPKEVMTPEELELIKRVIRTTGPGP